MILLDTNVIVRLATADPPEQAEKALQALQASETFLLTDVIAVETVYVLESFYGFKPEQISSFLNKLLQVANIESIDADRLSRALQLYVTHRMPMADAYLASYAIAHESPVLSFDKHFARPPALTWIKP